MELHGSDRRFGRTLSLNALALRVINGFTRLLLL